MLVLGSLPRRVQARPEGDVHDPNAACAPCHREIYERYRHTPMANASGPAAEGFLPADFVHVASGVHYRVTEEAGNVWLSYERESRSPDKALKGRQELRYFIGSGKRGRTYLFEQPGYWFEAPINWYAKKQIWDMAPNQRHDREMPLTMPVDPGCLHCHASNVARSLPEARNLCGANRSRMAGSPAPPVMGTAMRIWLRRARSTCSISTRLQAVRRDSVCLNCHLEGQAAVIRKDRKWRVSPPETTCSTMPCYFVYRGENGSGGRATSQWEALLRSECKKKSGDGLPAQPAMIRTARLHRKEGRVLSAEVPAVPQHGLLSPNSIIRKMPTAPPATWLGRPPTTSPTNR